MIKGSSPTSMETMHELESEKWYVEEKNSGEKNLRYPASPAMSIYSSNFKKHKFLILMKKFQLSLISKYLIRPIISCYT